MFIEILERLFSMTRSPEGTASIGIFLATILTRFSPSLSFSLFPPPVPPNVLLLASPDDTAATAMNLSYDHASTLANQWIMAWNRHDAHHIVDNHLDEQVELVSPFVFDITGKTILQGRAALRNYINTVLAMYPKLHFVLQDVLVGKDSVAIYYKSVNDRRECVILFVNSETGKVCKIVNHCQYCG
jgi:SnoaL-like domain